MIAHNSRDLFYRTPFGAVEKGTTVVLRLLFSEEQIPEQCRCNLWRKNYELEIDMKFSSEKKSFECTLNADSSGDPLWYYFVFIYSDGRMLFYGNNADLLGGLGSIYKSNPAAYQITVYDSGFLTPRWWKEGPVYHIFVDRFFKSKSYSPEQNPDFYYHENWRDKPLHLPRNGRLKYFPNDYFGGNLQGIIEKLGYISNLGIRTIYLSPVFEAHSNHKYDTADYSKIDASFGSNAIFKELCEKASELNISIILDGVFSHTGDDSIYFNKYNRYNSTGAYQSIKSPYHDWYEFSEFPDKYKCWWDVETMPTVNKDNPGFKKFICGEKGVVREWIKRGSSGWRLDVADELPMDFLKELRKGVKKENPESLIIGEVWEDASNKVSYGGLRNYCYGDTLDSVMNYPVRNTVLNFLSGEITSKKAAAMLESQQENYPLEFLNASMNLLGSHDRARLRTVLSGAPDPDTLTRQEQADYTHDAASLSLSHHLVKCAAALLFILPGVPHIYYGDEIGMTGMTDPFNRCVYPWGNEDNELLDFFKFIANYRKNNPVLIDGHTRYFSFHDDVFGCLRILGDECIFAIINRNTNKSRRISIAVPVMSQFKDITTGKLFSPGPDNSFKLELAPLSYSILTTT